MTNCSRLSHSVVGRGCAPVTKIVKGVSCAAGHANIPKDEKARFNSCVTCGQFPPRGEPLGRAMAAISFRL